MKVKVFKDIESNLILFQLLYFLLIRFFSDLVGLPSGVLYLMDLVNLVLILFCLIKRKGFLYHPPNKKLFIIVFAWFIIGLLSALYNGFHLLQWMWSLRNWYRLFTFMAVCIVCLNKFKIDKILRILLILFEINFAVIMIQRFFGLASGDQLNGIVGGTTNTFSYTFIIAVTVTVLAMYFHSRITLLKMLCVISQCLLISALSEMKFYFVEVIAIFLFFMLKNNKLTGRRLIQLCAIVLVSVVAMSFCIRLLENNYPEFRNFFNVAFIINSALTADGYGHSGYIDRLNGISVINNYLFDNNIFRIMLGIGAGNGEYSSFANLTSDFYNKHGVTFQYLRFTSTAIYLETGLVGLISYCMFFMNICLEKFNNMLLSQDDRYYWDLGGGTAVTCIIYIVYNNSLRTDCTFVMGFFLAIPYAVYINKKHLKSH